MAFSQMEREKLQGINFTAKEIIHEVMILLSL
jgi:hypothetical protein